MKHPRAPCIHCGEMQQRGGNAVFCFECSLECDKARQKCAGVVAAAKRSKRLPDPKSLICVDCGTDAYCYDHRNYAKPLEVEPVCQSCNIKRGPALPFSHRRVIYEPLNGKGKR